MNKTLIITSFLIAGLMSCQSQSNPAGQSSSTEQATGAAAETTTAADQTLPYQDINVEQFRQKMTEPGVVLMDVRTPEEIANGKIEGAKELDYFSDDFQKELAKLDKENTYLVYCRSGNRSGKTCKLMADMGFKHLYNMAGGYNAWSQQ